MKVAVLVYGEYREFDNVVDSWKIFNDLDCDFYFSTWDESNQISSKLGINKKISVSEQMIKFYLPNSTIDIKSEKNILEFNDVFKKHNSYKIYYHWSNLLRMVKNSNKSYDIVILIRPDIYLMWPYYSEVTFPLFLGKNIFENIKNKVYSFSSKHDKVCDDRFMMMEYNTTEKLIDKSQFFTDNIHTELWKFFEENMIEIIDHSYFIIPIMTRFNVFLEKDKEYFKFEKTDKNRHKKNILDYIHKKSTEWGGFHPKQTLWETPDIHSLNGLHS